MRQKVSYFIFVDKFSSHYQQFFCGLNASVTSNPTDFACKIVKVVGILVIQYLPRGSSVGCLNSSTIDKYKGSPITGTCKCLFYFFWVFANASYFTAVQDSSGGHKELYSIFEA